MIKAAARAVFLLLAAGSVWLNGRFALTNDAWEIMGSPSEVYPEFFFLFVGLPMALAALAGAAAWTWTELRGRIVDRRLGWSLGIALLALAASAWAAATPFMKDGDFETSDQWAGVVSNILFLGSPLLMLVQFGLAAIVVWFPMRRA